jgi:hypothetical protein
LTTGEILIKQWGLQKLNNVMYRRYINYPFKLYEVYYNSRLSNYQITLRDVKRKYTVNIKTNRNITYTPLTYFKNFNGDAQRSMFILTDLSGEDFIGKSNIGRNFTFQEINNSIIIKYKSIIQEDLTLDDIRKKSFYTGNENDSLIKYKKDRSKIMGTPNTNIKFGESELSDDGSITFRFITESTKYEDPDHKYKEIKPDLKNLNSGGGDTSNGYGNLKNNNIGVYIMELRINDFMEKIEFFELIEDGDFTQQDMKTLLELSESVSIACSCPSFYLHGGAYWLTQDNASILPCNIKPKFWDDPNRRGKTPVCKHLSGLLQGNVISFFLNNMGSSAKKQLKDKGLI